MLTDKVKTVIDKISNKVNKLLGKTKLASKNILKIIANKLKMRFAKIYRFIGRRLVNIKNSKSARINFVTNYIIPVITVVALIITFAQLSTKQFGLTVKYDGQTIATIHNESVIDKAQEIFNYNCCLPVEDATTPITYEITEIKNEDVEISSFSIFKKIVSMNEDLTKDVVGIYIDGDFIGATDDEAGLKSAVNNLFNNYKNSSEGTTNIECSNKIQYVSGIYPKSALYSCDELVDKISGLLDVMVVKDVYETTEIPYQVEYVTSDSIYAGYTSVEVDGQNGTETTTTRNKYSGDELVSSQCLGTYVTEEPVNEVISVGSKEVPSQSGEVVLTWPAPTIVGYESDFGYRWGRMHNGVDFSGANCYGDSIVAADGGVVTFAGYDDSGYGYYIIIDHQNGMKTLYGHCSELYVSAGDNVADGECIAAIGSSGRSTGAHLHFEVRINDTPVNPKLFL